MKKYILYNIFFLFIFSMIYSNITIHSTKDNLLLWSTTLVPSFIFPLIFIHLLSPYHLLYPLFKHMNALCILLFNINSYTMEIICNSLLLGFPASALYLEEYAISSKLNQKQYHRLISICFMASPSFILLSLSTIYPSNITRTLFIIQIISIFVLLLITRFIPIRIPVSFTAPYFYKQFYIAIEKSIHILLLILIYLIIIGVCVDVSSIFLPNYIKTPLKLLSEFSSGVFYLHHIKLPYPYLFITLLLSYGGFCVHLQFISLLNHQYFSYITFLKYRIVHILIAFILALLFFR